LADSIPLSIAATVTVDYLSDTLVVD
jgi:hypothetical protein